MIRFIHAADVHLDSPLVGLEQYGDTPVEEIHETGLREIARLDAEITALMKRLGLPGDVAALGAAYAGYYFMPDLLPELVPSLNRWLTQITPEDIAPIAATPILASLVTGLGARAGANRAFARAARLS